MIYVVIPTYQEIENISRLLEGLNSLKNVEVIVVDDNSPDGTAEAAEGRAIVIKRPSKLGIGSAVVDGIREALFHPDCQYIVTMDADLSHDPKDIPRLLVPLTQGVGLAQGSRYIKGGEIIGWNFHRKLQSQFANKLCKLLFHTPNEVTTSFRAYSTEGAQAVVDDANKSLTTGYEFSITSALAVKDKGLKTLEVPITFTNRTKGRSKLKTQHALIWLLHILVLFYKRRIRWT